MAKIFGKTMKRVRYSSDPTRYASLQGFLGGAELNEVNRGPKKLPVDECRNLERVFNSGVNRTDIPSRYGPARVIHRLYKTILKP